jgi:hypothetical protein
MENGDSLFNSLTVKELQEEIKTFGLSPVGTKHQIVERLEKVQLKLLKFPMKTLYYFGLEMKDLILLYVHIIYKIILCLVIFYSMTQIPSPFSSTAQYLWESSEYYGYWILLGIASSIGLGTGLHTFVLFLGPFIAKQTIAHQSLSFFEIYKLVLPEAFSWGTGTAIGELPPYFIARGARLAGKIDDEFDELKHLKQKTDKTFAEKIKFWFFSMLNSLGFVGILLAASIPNPLFDLAGITCGHFLVPFSTFFGATFIGKALIKASIQSFFVIFIFSGKSVVFINNFFSAFGIDASKFLEEQRKTFGKGHSSQESGGAALLSFVWNGFIFLMISYFVVSIIESLADKKFKEKFTPPKKA